MAKTLKAAKPPVVEQPSPADRHELTRKVLEARQNLGRSRREGAGAGARAVAHVFISLARFNTLKPVRVIQLYAWRRGPLMAAGIAYRMFFAIGALLVVGFSTLGLVISGDTALQELIVSTVDSTTPGLIDTDGEEGERGLATPQELFGATNGYGLALAISTAVMIFTSLGWISGMRQGLRGIFALEPVPINPVLVRVKDLGILLVLGVVLIITTGVGVVVNTLLDLALQWLGLSEAARPLTQFAGFAVMLLLDTAVAVILLHSAPRIDMPRKILLQGALIAGVGSTILRTFSTQLLGSGVERNQLLLPFAVILGLFIWFFLLSQVYLVAAAWCAVGTADAEADAERDIEAKAGTLRQQSRRAARK
ncbi:YihY/virulence factor BrkB family protein [Arthrobacter sp. H41]|uniref:YihY/virulence factor BrkB family protein n=1 Tax=Arthrobacter sp. H41 TaxID=1312978 RepID=UPI0004B0E3F7|nr:YihY/virulence factor BrkB family protein [Arthrobacter sp. H41]